MLTRTSTLLVTAAAAASVSGFSILPGTSTTTTHHTALNMGLFDGVKEAFSAPALERSEISSERETPIDRWMGWSVKEDEKQVDGGAAPAGFVDSMDETNYVAVSLPKPMGIIFEENDAKYGGIFVQSLKEGGVAAENGLLQSGDQLVAVGTKNLSGAAFDDALGAILDSEGDETKLTLFRGTADQFYGPTGPSKDWLEKFCEKGGVETK